MAGAVYGNASFGGATVGNTAVKLGTPLGNRTNIVIYNADPSITLYVGAGSNAANVVASSNNATASGYPVLPLTSLSLDFGPQISLYGIVSSGSIDVRWVEAY